jgi:hypothetical protein
MQDVVFMNFSDAVHDICENSQILQPVNHPFTIFYEVESKFLISFLKIIFEGGSRAIFDLDHHIDAVEFHFLLQEMVQSQLREAGEILRREFIATFAALAAGG